jgi:gluconate 2-dehydrogenase gamma chain
MPEDYLLTRREFIAVTSALVAAVPRRSLAVTKQDENLQEKYLADPWRTIAAVQQHMLPSGSKSPGANDIHALDYLRNMIAMPDVSEAEREFMLNGPGWLNEVTQKKYQQDFVELDTESRELALRQVETSRAGERWLSKILTYLLEALLSDPVYGGNAGTIGWQWLQHQPGFPRPPSGKTFNKLGTYHRRYTKA